MTISYTIFEIFEIAEQIEHNAAEFYRKAAAVAKDKSMRQLFLQLAEMEDNHEKTFAQMKANLDSRADDIGVFDPDNEMIYYLKAMAKSAGWEGKASPRVEFCGSETPVQIITKAVEAEKASINYYLGLKEFVPAQSAKEQVDEIIREEMSHVVTLQKHLEQLSG